MANIRGKCEIQGPSNILIKTQFILKFGNCVNRQHLVKAYFSYKQWSYIWTGRMTSQKLSQPDTTMNILCDTTCIS